MQTVLYHPGMFSLLLAVALVLLVPWLPVWMYRRLPRRPPDPLSEGQLKHLAAQLQRGQTLDYAEIAEAEEGPASTDFTHPRRPVPSVPAAQREEAERRSALLPASGEGTARTHAAPRLTLRSYHWLNFLSLPFFIGGFLALGVGWAYLLHVLGEVHARSFPPALFLFKPFAYGIIFAVPSIFLGIFTTLPVMVMLARLLMGRRLFLEYLFWDEGRFNQRLWKVEGILRLLTVLALLVGVSCAGFVGLAMNWYTRFTEDEIAVKPLFGFHEEKHAYGDIEQLMLANHRRVGKEIDEGFELGIRFRNGQTWSTGQTFQLPRDDAERARFLTFLVQKSGKPLKPIRLLDDMPGW